MLAFHKVTIEAPSSTAIVARYRGPERGGRWREKVRCGIGGRERATIAVDDLKVAIVIPVYGPKDLIHDYTGSVPRQINNLATACLLQAAVRNAARVDEALLQQTLSEFHLP